MAAPPLTAAPPRTLAAQPALARRHGALWPALAVAALTAVGLALRLRGLVVPWRDIWIDEAFSIWLAELPPWQAVRTIAQVDQHPPLYALLLHLWLLPRDDPWWARLSSVLLGTAAIPVAALLGRAARGWRLGLAAALLVTVSPDLVRYSQEVRMYALVSLLVFLSTLLLIRALEAGGRRRWAAFGLVTLLLVYSHNIALLLLPCQGLFVLWKARRDPAARRGYLVTMAAVGLLWLPWLPVLVHQSRGVIARFWIAPPTWPTVWPVLLAYLDAVPPKQATLAGYVIPLDALQWRLLLPFLALGLLGLAAGLRRWSPLYLLTFAGPIALNLLLSRWKPIFEERVLLYATTGSTMLLAAGVTAVRFLPLNALLLAPVLWLNVQSLDHYDATFKKEQWRDAAAYVAAQARPGDLLLFNATWAQLPFDYYYRRLPAAPALVEHGLPVDLFDRGVLEPPMLTSDLPTVARLTAGRQHVWVLLSHDWYNDPQHLIRPAVAALFPQEQTQRFEGIVLLRASRA